MLKNSCDIEQKYQEIRQDALLLAGNIKDLSQRACVYHHLYADSNGNNVFPLIAAHGALWGASYFAKGLYISKFLAWQFCLNPQLKQDKLQKLNTFADAFREINRNVCVEAYIAYYLTKNKIFYPLAQQLIPDTLFKQLIRCHAATENNQRLSALDREALFKAFFLWEQEFIVNPAVNKAVSELDWAVIKYISLKPSINFSYFQWFKCLPFKDFSSQEERIEKGMKAYSIAEKVGLNNVELALKRYKALPAPFFEDSNRYFLELKKQLCYRSIMG